MGLNSGLKLLLITVSSFFWVVQMFSSSIFTNRELLTRVSTSVQSR
ncbi:Uncharacterised protein [Segatella copri]|nr:Uncharacterised protein [Segatella copri]